MTRIHRVGKADSQALGRGFVAAERLYGKRDLYLPVTSTKESRAADAPCRNGDESRRAAEHIQYYERLLDGATPAFEQSNDPASVDGDILAGRSARQAFTLPAELCASLKDLGQRQRWTLKETLLTAWLATLHHYTGRDELIVGIPANGRLAGEHAASGGPPAATHALHTDLSGNPVINSLMARVMKVAERAAEREQFASELPEDASRRDTRSRQRNHAAALQLRFELTEETDSHAPNAVEFALKNLTSPKANTSSVCS